MSMRNVRIAVIAVLVMLSLIGVASAYSAESSGYSIAKSSIEGGVFNWSSGNNYGLGGSIGQHEAGLVTGGEYQLGGGVWPGGEPVDETHIYLPIVVR